MSIFDASVQDDWARDDLIAKIKAAEKKYYDESPCLHCGPGNGCDDCRGCEDSKRNYELEMNLRNAREAYKNRFGHSYDEDLMIQQIANKEKEVEHWRDHCKKCGGNFGDDCRDCSDWEKTFEVSKSLNWLKEEFKRKFHVDYDTLNKDKINCNNNMNKEEKRDLIIDKGVKIKEWINYNIKQHGAKNFFECVNNAWPEISESIKQSILDEISENIKPKQINTIEDLAKLLDGNEYRDELDNEYKIDVDAICRKNKWVIVFGASDDLIEFRGFIDDEDGAWDGALMKLVKPGDFYMEDEDAETYKKSKEYKFVPISESELKDIQHNGYQNTCVVEMLWCPDDSNASWQVNSKGAPFVRFNIMEDEELYCEAAIIDMSKLLTK